jgi:hypothetical protein
MFDMKPPSINQVQALNMHGKNHRLVKKDITIFDQALTQLDEGKG